MMKFCKRCGTDTERNALGRCMVCVRANSAKWAAANRDRVRATTKDWEAANPEKARALKAKWRETNRERARKASAEWNAKNPERMRAASARYYAANPEKARSSHAAWRAANPEANRVHLNNRRARKVASSGKLSKGLSDRLFKLQRGKCACGCKQPLGTDYHLDHIMPLALGGTNTDDNMQLLTALCNLQKHAKHPIDFMQQRGFLL